jgi:hypothetical protein
MTLRKRRQSWGKCLPQGYLNQVHLILVPLNRSAKVERANPAADVAVAEAVGEEVGRDLPGPCRRAELYPNLHPRAMLLCRCLRQQRRHLLRQLPRAFPKAA